ncbi:unnamed protein product [Phytomonas sp. EM1]|nr:unnamed protein product [Phytomonas sp. EM1]|eukprot:CCW60784.1 unnamed protein product [Phytomonas sp. isolate EM1]
MQATFLFSFPGLHRDVALRLFIPFPEQRPRTTANFLFLCTGALPPGEILRALKLEPGKNVEFLDVADARKAGLRPFNETALVRLEKGSLVEFGSAASRSIVKGGFLPDEPLRATAGEGDWRDRQAVASMRAYKAGTVLCGNAGLPHTGGSRYYLLLTDFDGDEARRELESCRPLGWVVEGLGAFQTACAGVEVHPRTLAPRKKIPLVACEVAYAYPAPASGEIGGERTGVGSSARPPARETPRERITGRVRPREEEPGEGPEAAARDSTPTEGQTCFFRFGEIYPTGGSIGGRSVGGSAAKRYRAERNAAPEDAEGVLRTTAVWEPLSSSPEGGSQGSFDFFKTQEEAFMNDLEVINETQRSRQQNRARRLGKERATAVAVKTGASPQGVKNKRVKKRY